MGKDLKGKELGRGLSQRADGAYHARFTDKFGKRHSLYNKSLTVLKQELKHAKEEVDRRAVAEPQRVYTLHEWYGQWMEVYKYEVRDSTRLAYSLVYEKHVGPALGKYKLSDITTVAVRKFLNSMKSAGYSFEMRNKARIIILDLFDKAIMDDFAFKNPARGIKLKRDDKEEPRVLSKEEQIDFFDACKGTFYDELFTVAVLTGLRPGELFALRWQDIDLRANTISVTRTLLYQKLEGDTRKEFHVHPPKTASSMRTVRFSDRCAQALKSQFRKKSNVALRSTSAPLEGLEDLLFVTKFNTPLCSQIYCDAIARIVELINEGRSDIDQFEKFSGHCFRHTYATRCFEAEVDPKVVQKQLGHASLQMTMDLYTHLFPDKKEEELSKFTSYSDQLFEASDILAAKRYEECLHPKVVNIGNVAYNGV